MGYFTSMSGQIFKLIFLATMALRSLPATATAKTLCLGPPDAKAQVIYFHGMDDGEPGRHEKINREMLEKIANKLKLKIAVPRGNGFCKGQRCWLQTSREQAEETYKSAVNQARSCLQSQDFVVIGFSNGGYLLSKVYHFCFKPVPRAILAIASSGAAPKEKIPAACSKHTLLIGDKDLTFSKAQVYHDALQGLGGETEFVSFKGAHVIPAPELEDWLRKTLK